jgi:hypothetical protein
LSMARLIAMTEAGWPRPASASISAVTAFWRTILGTAFRLSLPVYFDDS